MQKTLPCQVSVLLAWGPDMQTFTFKLGPAAGLPPKVPPPLNWPYSIPRVLGNFCFAKNSKKCTIWTCSVFTAPWLWEWIGDRPKKILLPQCGKWSPLSRISTQGSIGLVITREHTPTMCNHAHMPTYKRRKEFQVKILSEVDYFVMLSNSYLLE